ncbi:DUF1275 domain-containing protein [Luteibacter yeojuensis]|uniref:DUF1275 domain-containing protein n=1 Tax=Luteibacter yeojuensis TaxID=345309 RepID=A0A7X5QRM4_9GAMM|nr:DUF1275 domain-containing protein [Luteibacter yeojuensis]
MNAVALLSLRHGGVTHLTGISTEAAIGLGSGDYSLLIHAMGVVALFTGGCAISALVSRGPRWTPTAQSAALLFAVAGVLCMASWLMTARPSVGIMLCAFAMGLQNGSTSLTSGAVIRTSHLTGMFTDLGIAFGQRSWGGPVDRRRVTICLTVVLCFVAGATVGTMLYGAWQGRSLLFSSAMAALAAALTLGLSLRTRRDATAGA